MSKTLICVLVTLFSNYGYANNLHEYNLNTSDDIKSIYWLSKLEDSAIVYARFDDFYALRGLIDKTILTSSVSSEFNGTLENADKLLLMMPEQEDIFEVFITDYHIVFNGLHYQVDGELINSVKALNDTRIYRGDSISQSALSIAKEKFGRNF